MKLNSTTPVKVSFALHRVGANDTVLPKGKTIPFGDLASEIARLFEMYDVTSRFQVTHVNINVTPEREGLSL